MVSTVRVPLEGAVYLYQTLALRLPLAQEGVGSSVAVVALVVDCVCEKVVPLARTAEEQASLPPLEAAAS